MFKKHFIIPKIICYLFAISTDLFSQFSITVTHNFSSGSGKSDSNPYSNFGVIGGSFSNEIIRVNNLANHQGFMRNAEINTGIAKLTDKYHKILIFPNPAKNVITIEIDDTYSDLLTIYNLSGNKIIETEFRTSIDISGLPEGLYLLKIIDKKGICLYPFKLVKH